jgi:hypothetical protein
MLALNGRPLIFLPEAMAGPAVRGAGPMLPLAGTSPRHADDNR